MKDHDKDKLVDAGDSLSNLNREIFLALHQE